jgi:hypothetical protein
MRVLSPVYTSLILVRYDNGWVGQGDFLQHVLLRFFLSLSLARWVGMQVSAHALCAVEVGLQVRNSAPRLMILL